MTKNADKIKTQAMTKEEDESDQSCEMSEMRQALLKMLANEGEKTTQ